MVAVAMVVAAVVAVCWPSSSSSSKRCFALKDNIQVQVARDGVKDVNVSFCQGMGDGTKR